MGKQAQSRIDARVLSIWDNNKSDREGDSPHLERAGVVSDSAADEDILPMRVDAKNRVGLLLRGTWREGVHA